MCVEHLDLLSFRRVKWWFSFPVRSNKDICSWPCSTQAAERGVLCGLAFFFQLLKSSDCLIRHLIQINCKSQLTLLPPFCVWPPKYWFSWPYPSEDVLKDRWWLRIRYILTLLQHGAHNTRLAHVQPVFGSPVVSLWRRTRVSTLITMLLLSSRTPYCSLLLIFISTAAILSSGVAIEKLKFLFLSLIFQD